MRRSDVASRAAALVGRLPGSCSKISNVRLFRVTLHCSYLMSYLWHSVFNWLTMNICCQQELKTYATS